MITTETPLAEPMSAYGASKRDAEELVRGWQDDGAPVLDFVIDGVYGPLDTFMLAPDRGLGVIDVRDLAGMFCDALKQATGPRRYLAGGRYLDWAEWTALLAEASGARDSAQAAYRRRR